MMSISVSSPVVDNPDDGEIAREFFASCGLTSCRGPYANHPIARYASYGIYGHLGSAVRFLFDY